MKLRLLAIALLIGSIVEAAPQETYPDAPAARQFAAWLEVFNSDDKAKLLAYLQKNNPERAVAIDDAMGFRRMTGGFDFKKTEESTATKFTGIVKERGSDMFARFVMEVESAQPYRIAS